MRAEGLRREKRGFLLEWWEEEEEEEKGKGRLRPEEEEEDMAVRVASRGEGGGLDRSTSRCWGDVGGGGTLGARILSMPYLIIAHESPDSHGLRRCVYLRRLKVEAYPVK